MMYTAVHSCSLTATTAVVSVERRCMNEEYGIVHEGISPVTGGPTKALEQPANANKNPSTTPTFLAANLMSPASLVFNKTHDKSNGLIERGQVQMVSPP